MRVTLLSLTGLLVLLTFTTGLAANEAQDAKQDDSVEVKPDAKTVSATDQVFANYFHGNQRCVTCQELEEFSELALKTGFEQKLADSTLVWRAVNYDQEDNKHYIDDYKLFTKALILSRVNGGKEVEWKNLDKIWQLVGNKDRFVEYVQKETCEFMKTHKK